MVLSDAHGHRGIEDVANVSNRTYDMSTNSAIDLQTSLAVVTGYVKGNVPREIAALLSIYAGQSRSRELGVAGSHRASIKMIPNLESLDLWSEVKAGANGGGLAPLAVFRAGTA